MNGVQQQATGSADSPQASDREQATKPRPPIVVVVGHVDHGKTTLLDYIRKSNVAEREAGGITQAIAAYEITHNGKKMTFIDTPGHEAFSKMRARGAAAADLAILVVAADEGVKPQTAEAIQILNESKTPFVVALNKIDKGGANVEKVKNDLTAAGVYLEGYGGQVSYQAISAKTGEGINELLDLILLSADMESLIFNPVAPARGYILETQVSRQRGLEAWAIIKDGVLRTGDAIATERARGKVKILEDFLGKQVKSLEPSAPALIVGFETLPDVGEGFTTGSEAEKIGEKESATPARAGVAGYAHDENTFNIILKANDAGSLQALSAILGGVKLEKPLKIVSESVGDVTDNDVKLAISANASVVAFKSRVGKTAAALAQVHGVAIVTSDIIYKLVETVEQALRAGRGVGVTGELEVLAVFNKEQISEQLVGGRVVSGTLKNKLPFEIVRAGAPVGSGRILNLRQQKTDLEEAAEGSEVGVLASASVEIQTGDRLVAKP